MQLGNLTCWISVNSARLEEYGVEEDGEKRERIAWIASEPDKSFCVNWRDPDRTRATSGKLQVDGVHCGATVLEVPRLKDDEIHKSHVLLSATEGRPLQFGKLDLTDDDTYLKKDAKDVGQIEVHLWHVRVKSKNEYRGIELTERTQVHEKTKKGLQLAVKFGAKETVPRTEGVTGDYIERLATFIFRYRTIDMLRANGIAPPARSPSPAAGARGSPAIPAARPSAVPPPVPSAASSSSNPPVVSTSGNRPIASSSSNPSAATSSSSPGPVAGRKRRASEALTPEPQDVKPEIKPEIDLVALDEAEERVRQIEEQYRRAKQELEQRRRNKKVKIEEITSFISGEVIDLTED